MPSYVYLSTDVDTAVDLTLVPVGPTRDFDQEISLERSRVEESARDVRVLKIDRTGHWHIGDAVEVFELQFAVGPRYVGSLQLMVQPDSLVKDELWWAWRTAAPGTGTFTGDHDPHSTTVWVGGILFTFVVQGRGTFGPDDIYVTVSGHRDTSRWMENLAAQIGPRELRRVAIPGTHDSATYAIDGNSPWAPDAPWWASRFVKGTIAGWARTQGRTTAEQLRDGIRYFDLRVWWDAGRGDFFVVHALSSVPVRDVLDAVRDFLAGHPREIVFLDFNQFFAMDDLGPHQALATLIRDRLGALLLPRAVGTGITVNAVWARAERVIVPYARDDTVNQQPLLWFRQEAANSAVSSPWPDTGDLGDLRSFLATRLPNRRPNFFVLQGVLTPGFAVVSKGLLSPPSSLEQWARTTTPAVVGWVRTDWVSSGLNIVIVDFYEHSEMVSAVIDLNLNA